MRKDFPIFKKNPNLVYLDSAATALKPQCVIDAVNEYYEKFSANVHRGLYRLSEKATSSYENAREIVRSFINAKSSREIIFTSGTTHSINIVAQGWGEQNLSEGDEIILTILEHHSNIVPWQMIAKEKKCVIKFLDIDKNGVLKIAELSKLLTKRTRIISVSHISNALGTINPIKTIIKRAHKTGSKVFIDAAQSAPHLPLDVQKLDCDFLAFSAHKMCGPTGIGILYSKEKILERTEPFFGGGDMISEVYKTHSKWNDLPWKFEAGTPPIAEAIGLGAAINYLQKIGFENIKKHEVRLLDLTIKKLQKIPGVKLFGPLNSKIQSGILSFAIDGVHPHDIAAILDQENIAIRAGHHCCMPLMQSLKIPATARASFYVYNTEEDIEKLAQGILKVRGIFEN
ncbi:cysteine desulfurase [Candidatus Peregrinibacteria bacterium]|nr:cysteine desulfurase [Candidatus Peregrinibacteria bacterium]